MEMDKILNQIVIVMLNISLWQGRKKLRAEDLTEKGIDASSLPPEKLASLGSKRIVSTEAVNSFMTLRRKAERACLSVGVRCLGGFGIPEDRLKDLKTELDEVKAKFAKDKEKFLNTYEVTVDAWATENPEWEAAIRRAVDPKAVVENQFQCNYTVFKFKAAEGAEETLEEEVKGLRGQLSRETAQMAKTAWETTFKGKLSVTQRAINCLKAIQEKLDGLSFLDGSVGTLAQSIQTIIAQCAGKTPIEGVDLMSINGILATLMDLDRVRFSSEVEEAEVAAMPIAEPEAEIAGEEQLEPEETIVKATQPDLAGLLFNVVEPAVRAEAPAVFVIPASSARETTAPAFTYKPPAPQKEVNAPAGWF